VILLGWAAAWDEPTALPQWMMILVLESEVEIQLPFTPAFPAAQSESGSLPVYALQHVAWFVDDAVAVDVPLAAVFLVLVGAALEIAEDVSEQDPNPAWHPVPQYDDPVPQYPYWEQHDPWLDPTQVYPLVPPQLPSLATEALDPVLLPVLLPAVLVLSPEVHDPKLLWQPVPQYPVVEPQYPYVEQQDPKLDPEHV
jgi:hypothetical protein